MNRGCLRLLLIALCVVAFPFHSPAPWVYTPGEGWSYEPVGGETKWRRTKAKDQLEVAQTAFDQKSYDLAMKAARRVIQQWPLSDYAPQAQYLVARCYEAKGEDEKAFDQYQTLLEKYAKAANYQEILQRQFEIANRFLGGEWFKLWGYVPYRSMDKTAGLYTKIVKNGPYSDIAPQAQLNIGACYERETVLGFIKMPDYPAAVKAYELAADRYHDRPKIAAEALFRAGLVYTHEALTAEYDQSTAGQAITTFTDFKTLYPDDPRVPDAEKTIAALRTEQARGNFQIAKFYEKYHKWKGALIYYNEVAVQDPNSPYAAEAAQRIAELKARTEGTAK
jgi:outer membrane assembly lipoprotein YfiO